MRLALLASAILLLAACGGGGGDAAASAPAGGTHVVTTYHPSGRIAETGAVDNATNQRVGEWTAFHDAEGSPRLFLGSYVAGNLDRALPWREWNVDGSIRADGSDR